MLIVQGQPVQNASKDYVLDDGQATQDWLLPAAMEALTDMLELDGGIPEESKSVIENACMMSRWCLLGNAEKLRRRQAEQSSVLKQRIVDLAGLYILFLSHPVSFPFLFSLQHPLLYFPGETIKFSGL